MFFFFFAAASFVIDIKCTHKTFGLESLYLYSYTCFVPHKRRRRNYYLVASPVVAPHNFFFFFFSFPLFLFYILATDSSSQIKSRFLEIARTCGCSVNVGRCRNRLMTSWIIVSIWGAATTTTTDSSARHRLFGYICSIYIAYNAKLFSCRCRK